MRSISGFIHAAVTLPLQHSKTRVLCKCKSTSRPLAHPTRLIRKHSLRFVLGVTQAVVQLAGVVKRHVETYTVLNDKTVLIESKANRSYAFLEDLTNLIEVPGIRSVLFTHAFTD